MTVATGRVVVLNAGLQVFPVPVLDPKYAAWREQAIKRHTDQVAYAIDEKNTYAVIRRPDVRTDSFLDVVSDAYNRHESVSIAPQDLWYIVLTEIAAAVNAQPDQYRALFTRAEGKVQLMVPTDDPTELPLDLIEAKLRQQVPVDMGLFLPEFSTHTAMSRTACVAAFADAAKSYYGYGTFMCGIRAVEFRGSEDDWLMFVERTMDLRQALPSLTKWLTKVTDRARQIAELHRGGDEAFVKDIFRSQNVGSGGELKLNGWLPKEFFREGGGQNPLLKNWPKTWSIVPFKNFDTGREFADVFGCFDVQDVGGFQVAGYDRFTFEKKGPRA